MLSCHSTRVLDLNLEKLRLLDRAIRHRYVTWVDKAPEGYTEDNFFKERIPIIVTTTYGQNQQLGREPGEESINWGRDRDYSKVRFMTVALATHYS